jgi:hypothetical protein
MQTLTYHPQAIQLAAFQDAATEGPMCRQPPMFYAFVDTVQLLLGYLI